MTPRELYDAINEAASALAEPPSGLEEDLFDTQEELYSIIDITRNACTRSEVLDLARMSGAEMSAAQLHDPAIVQSALVYAATRQLCPLPVKCLFSIPITETHLRRHVQCILHVDHPMRRILFWCHTNYGVMDPREPLYALHMLSNALTDCWDTSEMIIGYKAAREELRRERAASGGDDT